MVRTLMKAVEVVKSDAVGKEGQKNLLNGLVVKGEGKRRMYKDGAASASHRRRYTKGKLKKQVWVGWKLSVVLDS